MSRVLFYSVLLILFCWSLISIIKVVDRKKYKFGKFLIWLLVTSAVGYLLFIKNLVSGRMYLVYWELGLLLLFLSRRSFAFAYIKKRTKQFSKFLEMKIVPHIISPEDLGYNEDEDINPLVLVNAVAYEDDKGKKYIAFTPAAVTLINEKIQDFIIAHEIAHHYLGHTKRNIFREIRDILLPYFSKKEEREADRTAIILLKNLNLDPSGAIEFFQVQSLLCKEHKWYVKLYIKLRGTHPLSREREQYIKEMLSSFY